MADINLTVDPVSKIADMIVRLFEVHNKYLELMTPEQRAKYIDRQMADNDTFFALPRRIAERIAKRIEE